MSGEGILRFGLVGDVLPAVQEAYPCSRIIFPKIGRWAYLHLGIFTKISTYFLRFCDKIILKNGLIVKDFFMKKLTHVKGFL